MDIHNLKTWPDIFKVMKTGEKTFDIRKNDRDFKVGDQVILHEYDPDKKKYTGDHIHAKITWILPTNNPFHNLYDKVILALKYWDF